MRLRCAILDDYQNVALSLADWAAIQSEVDLKVFNRSLGNLDQTAAALADYSIVCLMRERTAFPRAMFEKLPNLKLLVTSGARNAAIDVAAAKDHNVVVCGTESLAHPTAELAFGLMLAIARKIPFEDARMKAGEPWQTSLGADLNGKTLGVIGLGKLGSRIAKMAQAFGMQAIAWSPNLTEDKCKSVGVAYASKNDLFRNSDFISVHMVLSGKTRGLIGAAELAQMRPTAYIVNTSRGPIVDESALIAALKRKAIAGAALDVYDTEPLPRDHPLRQLPNALLTPHLGYVTVDNYRLFYTQMVEAIRGFLDRKPVRIITP